MPEPRAFGYMRIERGTTSEQSDNLRQEMAEFVASRGLTLSEVFVESDDSASSAFAALIDALHASDVTTVAVPSVRHFAHMQGVGAAMMELIESETGACILIVATPDNACAV
jgi:DNA invertase Pin-like site-specific DNA recombinase